MVHTIVMVRERPEPKQGDKAMFEASEQTFIQSADSRETSAEIMGAIDWLSTSEKDAERIWASPTNEEMLAIWERATNNGNVDSDELYWGDSGNQWWTNK